MSDLSLVDEFFIRILSYFMYLFRLHWVFIAVCGLLQLHQGGLVALPHVGYFSSLTRDRTCAPCIGRLILNQRSPSSEFSKLNLREERQSFPGRGEKKKVQMEKQWDHFFFYRQKIGLRKQNWHTEMNVDRESLDGVWIPSLMSWICVTRVPIKTIEVEKSSRRKKKI